MDFLKVFIVISFVIATILTLKFHPEMHHPLIIEDEHFKLTRISDTISTKNIPISTTTQKTQTIQTPLKQTEVNIQQPIKKAIEQTVKEPIKQSQTKYVATENIKPVQKEKNITYNTNPQVDQSQIELLQKLLNEVEKEYNTQTQTSNPQQTIQPKQTKTSPKNSNFNNPYMTEQEEIIAWNKWRSNVQNQIMRNSNIEYAPLGTMFSFNFVVDKFGNVSNIKVDCSNPNYMDVARNNVKTAITKLQNQPILNFPKGTQRKSTVVQGYFFIGLEERYSTPNNFSDFERITY